jgi:hypothetical protein
MTAKELAQYRSWLASPAEGSARPLPARDPEGAPPPAAGARQRSERVVGESECWDILHVAHIRQLRQWSAAMAHARDYLALCGAAPDEKGDA